MDDRSMICNWIEQFIEDYPKTHDIRTRWKKPIIGVADANDPLYEELKTIVGPTHALPSELVPNAKSVVVIFAPFVESIPESNIPGDAVSSDWDYSYVETNDMLNALSQYMYERITAQGYQASNLPATYNFDPVKLKSDWSHRSSAYIAGVGTFGINNMMITDQGCCGRFGSIITDWELEPTPRSEEERCLFKRFGTCAKCVSRCPVGAYTIEGRKVIFDRFKCNEQIYELSEHLWEHGQGHTCGKCLVGLPCSFRNPTDNM